MPCHAMRGSRVGEASNGMGWHVRQSGAARGDVMRGSLAEMELVWD